MEEQKPLAQRRRRAKKVKSVDEVQSLLAGLLPSLIQSATISYEAFSKAEIPVDAKGFAAHHAACKSALSHVELLTKLARWAEKTEESAPPSLSEDDEIAGLLAGARAALQELDSS
ncbi:conserved hypothetical protein [Candidatus Terasakiella magnetica]|uniref:Uncharacterized protein n=1 Tax=Candidatus Terasakiella magnetica TaxID=1867952 RepID=A0A1C3RDP2_9PROT|nr:hypothetical protein [Candidatus Terasakiella magnetica]SCA55407.1 conserved hypothetical protein [Candidatus Terasakiella magnetica]